jgi:hypothetical protein
MCCCTAWSTTSAQTPFLDISRAHLYAVWVVDLAQDGNLRPEVTQRDFV